jgi:hypothetical protein
MSLTIFKPGGSYKRMRRSALTHTLSPIGQSNLRSTRDWKGVSNSMKRNSERCCSGYCWVCCTLLAENHSYGVGQKWATREHFLEGRWINMSEMWFEGLISYRLVKLDVCPAQLAAVVVTENISCKDGKRYIAHVDNLT